MKTLHLNDIGGDVPLHFRFSFAPFVRYLEQRKSHTKYDQHHFLYNHLIEQFSPYSTLTQSIDEVADTPIIEGLFRLVEWVVEPLHNQERNVPFSIGLPGPLKMFYYSEAFERLVNNQDGSRQLQLPEDDLETRIRSFYQLILERCYHVPDIHTTNPTVTFRWVRNGITKYFRVSMNMNFINPSPTDKLPPLQPAWVNFAKGIVTLNTIPVPLPLDQFVFDGFITTSGEEITAEATLQELREVFVHLQTDSERQIYQRFVQELKNLCGKPGVEIGMMPLLKVNGNYVIYPEYSNRSIFLRRQPQDIQPMTDPQMQQFIDRVNRLPYPILIPNFNEFDVPDARMLHEMGVRSLLVYPVVAANEVIGTLEMVSPEPGVLDEDILLTIERVIPLVRELLLFQQRQFTDRIEQIIQQKFTPLQPSVAWKFREAAWAYMSQRDDMMPDMDATRVCFPQVHPLYGAIDIRNSSFERNKAVRHDFRAQLQAVEQVLDSSAFGLPASLLSQSQHWLARLANGLSSEEEVDLSMFLMQQVNPYLQQLRTQHPNDRLDRYAERTNPITGLFNEALRNYEQSLERINSTLSIYLEQQITFLQKRYPIYYEKYRTDGLEYNLYAGPSIAPDMALAPDYLDELHLWQLTSMIEMAQLTNLLRPQLPLPFQTTQLLLTHAQSVDISFRRDERRFDVEGSYSIRYEVIKKRIDKALIKGSQERLTQPDTIAIIYTHSHELYQLSALISRLQTEGKVKQPVEYLELEPLQGVLDLKALRLSVNY